MKISPLTSNLHGCIMTQRAVNSVGECFVDIEEVAGSNPVLPKVKEGVGYDFSYLYPLCMKENYYHENVSIKNRSAALSVGR